MRRINVCTTIILLASLYASPPLLAGPLDRMDTGLRVNPATNSMLRVPGVVGMDYQSALATLQQAGLNPRVHMLHKRSKQYAGQEGIVVKQLPVAGGIAMLGSSVSISVYVPDASQAPPDNQGNGGIDTGAVPGQEGPAAGDNGNGTSGPDNGGFVPPAGSAGNGWQGPSSVPVPTPQPPVTTPALHPIMVKHPTIPEKKKTPVVKVPVKRPGTYSRKAGQESGAGVPPSEPERKKTPVAKVPVKKSGKKKMSAPTGGDSGKIFKPVDWGQKITGGVQAPSVPKKPEGHSALLGSQGGGL